MEFRTVQAEKYGVQVQQHPEMDNLRKSQCLCLNCAKVNECGIAADGLSFCLQCNVAFAMTRCPDFVRREVCALVPGQS